VLAGKQSADSFDRFFIGLTAGLSFAVHPAKVEVVANITHRAEAICSIFFICTLLLFCRSSANSKATDWKWLLCGCVAYALSAFSKETGLTAIGCTIAIDGVRLLRTPSHDRSAVATQCGLRALALGMTAAAVLQYRSSISGEQVTPRIPYTDNPAAKQDTLLLRYLSYGVTHTRHALCLLFPTARLDYSLPIVPVVESIFDVENLYTLLLYAVVGGCTFLALHPDSKTFDSSLPSPSTPPPSLLFAASVFVIVLPFVPASNLLFPVGLIVADRVMCEYCYMPL
jgi:hypothetical protein